MLEPEPLPEPLDGSPELAALIEKFEQESAAQFRLLGDGTELPEKAERWADLQVSMAHTLVAMRKHFRNQEELKDWCEQRLTYKGEALHLLPLAELTQEEARRRLIFDYRHEQEWINETRRRREYDEEQKAQTRVKG